jgi:tetratricopeptide (TPR) repeat protein
VTMQRFICFLARRLWPLTLLLIAFLLAHAFGLGGWRRSLGWPIYAMLGGIPLVHALAFALRQAWVLPRVFRKAEHLWASRAPVAEVLAAAEPLAKAVGELGYRGYMLRSWAFFALGQRHIAELMAELAYIAREPWWVRRPVRICMRFNKAGRQWPSSLAAALIPDYPIFCRTWAKEGIASKDDGTASNGWSLMLACASLACDDPLFLDGCMAMALGRLESNQNGKGRSRSGPEARALLERCMALLLHKHSDPRLPWNRGRLAAYLSSERRDDAVLALCGGLPPAFRSVDIWLLEARTWGRVGNLNSAWAAIDSAVKVHPSSYRLWLEAYRIAMARSDARAAFKSLEHAGRYSASQCAPHDRWEFDLAKSEYCFWVEGNAGAAWKHLSNVPEKQLEGCRPLYKAQLLLSQNSFEEAYSNISELLISQPSNTDLRLMQSEAMAGMGAWEALLPYLASLGEEAGGRAGYWHLMGMANKGMANSAQSREDFERAAWMESFNIRYIIDAGAACVELGEYARSEQYWKRAIKLDPHNKEALLGLAYSSESRHDLAAAKSLLRECLIHHPDFQPAYEMLLRLDAN